MLGVVGFPVVYNLLMSVQEVNLGNIAQLARPFVGVQNYAAAVGDPTFRKAAANTLVFVAVNVVGQVGIGMIVAACFARDFAGAAKAAGKEVSLTALDGYNHFEVMEQLGNPLSLFSRAVLGQMKLAAG